MGLNIRRVVTGHDDSGRAVVKIDAPISRIKNNRPKVQSTVIWATQGYPVDNDDPADGAERLVSTSEHDGTVFRIVSYEPGATPRNHRTDSIDYAVVMSGEIVMDLDGTEVTLKAGDVLVQRGTIHNWINRGSVPCVIAFVLVAAKPARAAGKELSAVG